MRTTEEMVEKVAEALFNFWLSGPSAAPHNMPEARLYARAAIEAMPEPVPHWEADLRDTFAGQALMVMLSGPTQLNADTPRLAAEWAYKMADAMMAQRRQK